MDIQSSNADKEICQFPSLSRIAFKLPDDSARMIDVRPHPAWAAACFGESVLVSMTGLCPHTVNPTTGAAPRTPAPLARSEREGRCFLSLAKGARGEPPHKGAHLPLLHHQPIVFVLVQVVLA